MVVVVVMVSDVVVVFIGGVVRNVVVPVAAIAFNGIFVVATAVAAFVVVISLV